MPRKSTRALIILVEKDVEQLNKIAIARSEELRKVVRARIILMNQAGHSDKEIAATLSINRHTVELTLGKCVTAGVDGALNDTPRTGRGREIGDDAKAWVTYIACHKPV